MRNTDLAVDALAVYRLSRLVARDTFPPVQKARDAWYACHPLPGQVLPPSTKVRVLDGATIGERGTVEWAGETTTPSGRRVKIATKATGIVGGDEWYAVGDPLGEVVDCGYCNSIWLAAGVVAARRYAPRVWDPVARLLAFSAVTVFATVWETKTDE